MERLTLNRRPKTGDKVECLPAGDGLPIWSTIPLDAKLPMMDSPKGAVTLFTTKLGEPKHKCKQEYDFDLRDPNGKYICNEYKPLHDPHLKAHFKSQDMRHHLIKKGFISEDDKVQCSLKEFNQYRRYLRHVFFLEIAKERREELDKIHKIQQANEQRCHKTEVSFSRGTIVRRRLQQQREENMHRINNDLLLKGDRLQKRLHDVREGMASRERKQREDAERRQQTVYRNQQETEQRKLMLMKKWRQQDRLRLKLLEDREMQRKMQTEMKCFAKWDERKEAQKEMLAQGEAIMRKDEEDRQANIDRREKYIAHQRHILKCKLERLKQNMHEEKVKRDAHYAKRFEEKMASGDYRVWSKRRDRRRSRGKKFCSTWKLEDILSNLTLTDTEKQERGHALMNMINEAFDGTDEEEELEELQAQARQIVQDVLSSVTNDIYPAYLKMLEEEEDKAAAMSRSVRFCTDDYEIDADLTPEPGYTPEPLEPQYGAMRPVSEHILTPCPSQLEIQKLEAGAIFGSPELGDKITSVSFVETLLLRLLDDLNGGRLSSDDIMKLASYSMDILQSAELKDGTILEAQEEMDIKGPYGASSSSSIIAKKMVDFTLGRILADIQTGNVHPDDLASLTVSLLDNRDSSVESSASISVSDADLDTFIDEALRTATSTAMDPREDSPVCEALLDEFMVNTLKNLIQDIENEVLSKSQIETLAISVKDETQNILSVDSNEDLGDSKTLQKVLLDLLQQLKDEKIDIQTMYQIVFAIVYSYSMVKAPSTPSFENRITYLMRDLLNTAEQKAAAGELEDLNINIVHEANERLSLTNLDVGQIEKISSSIISTISKPEVVCRTTTSDIARSIVENSLKKAIEQLEGENASTSLTQGVQNVAEAVIITTSGVENVDWSATEPIADTLTEVLTNLRLAMNDSDMIEPAELDDIDDLIAKITVGNISSEQVEGIAISVARILRSPVKSESSMSACLVVADVLRKVNEDLQRGSLEDRILKDMLETVTTSFRATQTADVHSPSMLNALSFFLKTVLCFVSNKVQSGEFSEIDIQELSTTMKDNIQQNQSLLGLKESVFDSISEPSYSNLEPKPKLEPEEVDTKNEADTVLQYFQILLEKIDGGEISSEVMGNLGKRLIHCGKSLLENTSGCLTPGSELIADNVVEEVIRTLQLEITSGTLTQESIKEITKTIISSTSSMSMIAGELVGYTIRGIHRDIERGHEPSRIPSLPSLDHSPSASTVASHIVLQTIDAIQKDLSHNMFDESLIKSIVSMISDDLEKKVDAIPGELERVKPTIRAIVTCLKNDSIDKSEAERIFCTILEHYKSLVSAGKKTTTESLSEEDRELVNSLVTETLKNIERSVRKGKIHAKEFSIPSLSTSDNTSVVADELINLCLETIKEDLSHEGVHPRRRYKDIGEFIIDIVAKLQYELSEGTISNLSMAHFFQAISSDPSDLRTLEANATENLSRVISDIQFNGNKSIYIHRILENYLSIEHGQDSIFNDPVQAVESILISVSSDILRKFVKATLQNILIEMREGCFNIVKKTPSVFAIQSASSLIAENVIQEVITRIKEDMTKSVHRIHGNVNKQELQRAASKLLSETPTKHVTSPIENFKKEKSNSDQSRTSVRSKDIEDIVLETLHNIVSNLRFEQSVQSNKKAKNTDDHASDISSEVQDFVLHTLQNIVTDLQDRRSQMELGLHSKYGSSIELASGESKEATAYVNEVLQTVLNDMKHELATKYGEQRGNDETIDSDSSNIETHILECLQNATKDARSKQDGISLEPSQRKDVKQIIIESMQETLNNVRGNILSYEDLQSVHDALIKFLEEPKAQGNDDQTLQDRVVESLEKVLEKIKDTDVDENTLNRISSQVATLGMDSFMSERRSPDNVVSDSSVSSSVISDLVKDVLTKITEQIDDDGNKTVENGQIQQSAMDVNFNRKESASSSTTALTSNAESQPDRKTSFKKLNSGNKGKDGAKELPERDRVLKKTHTKSQIKQNGLASPSIRVPRANSPKQPGRNMSPKQSKDRKDIPNHLSPTQRKINGENKPTKAILATRFAAPECRKSISLKASKSEQIPKRKTSKSPLPVSSSVMHDQKRIRKKSSKKKKDARHDLKPLSEDSSVVRSLCGAHQTKMSIREDQNL